MSIVGGDRHMEFLESERISDCDSQHMYFHLLLPVVDW